MAVLDRDDPRIHQLVADTRWAGVVSFEQVASTQDVALERIGGGHAVGEVIVASRQSAGRGRRGRSWLDSVTSADGQPANLAVTATATAPAAAGLVPLAAGLAVDATYAASGAQTALKWPNDVLIGGRKAAGILVEQHTIDRQRVVLIGTGLNLDWRGVQRSDDARQWISLAEATQISPDRVAVLVEYLRKLDALLQTIDHDKQTVVDEYRRRCATIGQTVEVALPGGMQLAGVAVGVDDDGQLLIDRHDEGRSKRIAISAGDVTHVRPVPS
ncbi:MAG: biotin--[acetyl-CoA-carboxylase] ligase [Nitriliruptoraceae bacterium]